MINSAEHMALATEGAAGLNVVPVSMVIEDGGKLVICDCFMQKTRQNAQGNGTAALALWTGMAGVQIKGTIGYETNGEYFDRYTDWLKEKHPERILQGVVILTPTEEHDLAPTIR